MCGLGGFTGVENQWQRWALVRALGRGIDARGGDAAGFIATTGDGDLRYARKLGMWRAAGARFVAAAATGTAAVMLHARFATLPNADDVNCAHPFAIRRRGKTVLWGAHNGAVTNAHASAAANGREFSVDSKEVFELLADGKIADIGRLDGWGALSWVRNDDRTAIRLCAASEGGALCVVRTTCGAIVYASTSRILVEALVEANMWPEQEYCITPGVIYIARGGQLASTTDTLRFREPDAWDTWGESDKWPPTRGVRRRMIPARGAGHIWRRRVSRGVGYVGPHSPPALSPGTFSGSGTFSGEKK